MSITKSAANTSCTKKLAAYAVETRFEDYPKEVIDQAKILIMDSIGCMFGGCHTNLGKAIMTPIKSMGGNREATVVGGGIKVPTIQAAFVNGATANALDYDDTLSNIGHPGSSIIPAALSIGEWRKASGKDVINAILIGYDVGNRIGMAIQPTYERGQHIGGAGPWQTFSAVSAAARVLNLDLAKTLNAYGVAGATAPIPNLQKWGWDISERPIHWVKTPTGWPCWTGTTAAVLAYNGFIGNNYILDGDNGFWIMAGSDRCDYDKMTDKLGSEFEARNISIKPYPSCRWQHASLDCINQLKQKNNLMPEEIEEILIHSSSVVKPHEIYGPADMIDAQFSLPYVVAMILSDIQPGPYWYTQNNLKDKKILNLSKKVKVKVDPAIDKLYFEKARMASRVEIITKGGGKLESYVDVPFGDPLNPMSQEAIEDKFKNLALHSLEPNQVERIIEKIYELETIEDISTFMALLVGD